MHRAQIENGINIKFISILKNLRTSVGLDSARGNKGITLIALIITIIVLLILAGVALNFVIGENGILKHAEFASNKYKNSVEKEENQLAQIDSYINGNRGTSNKVSDLVQEVTFEVKEISGFSIKVQIYVKSANADDTRGYFVYINGEVIAVKEDSLITIKNLSLGTEYAIKCGIIDKHGNIRESAESKVTTLANEVLYNGTNYSNLITGFTPFRVDNASSYTAYKQGNGFYQLIGLDTNGRAGINTSEKVDLTNVQKIEINTGLFNNYGSSFIGTFYLGIYTEKDSTLNFSKSVKYSTNAVQANPESKIIELDVSDITGEYYIKAVSVHPSNVTYYGFYAYIYSITLK